MMGWALAATVGLGVWLVLLTVETRRTNRDLSILMASVRQLFAPERQIGGRSLSRRRTDFRVPVELEGFVRVLDHAKPCHVTDLSKNGAQVVLSAGTLPVGQQGVLTIEFADFGSATSHVKVIRFIESTNSYGLRFVDAPHEFYARCSRTVENALARALTAP